MITMTKILAQILLIIVLLLDIPFVVAQSSSSSSSSSNNNNNNDNNNEEGTSTNSYNNDTLAEFGTDLSPTADACPLQCNNGSVCMVGASSFKDHPKETGNTPFTFQQQTSKDGWHCLCPEGWTGLRCNRPYNKCPVVRSSSDTAVTGDINDHHYCYHGGECIAGVTDGQHPDIDKSERFCDCSNAQHNGIPYFGKYCDIEGAVQCGPDSEQFCTAQGTCKENFEKKAHPCDCLVGHRGPHCEFVLGTVPPCVLPCGGATINEDGTVDQPQTGGIGQCVLGVKSFEQAQYQDFWLTHDGNYQYCKCPENWFGDNCNVPGETCGDAHCFNGGACLETLNAKGETTYACDCRVAGHNGFSYAGQYCENIESDNCNADGNIDTHANGAMFCTNGGTCKDPNNPHLGCDCVGMHFGPLCEYHKVEDGECSLKCQNDGQCRTGLKDNSLIEKLGAEMSAYNVTKHSEIFEHCVCPSEFFGIQCEHKLAICPGGDHVCLHGSQCVAHNEGGTDGDEIKYTCDCDQAFDAVERYAGSFCQYTSTDICTINGQPGMGKANFAFCVNNGSCKGKVKDGEDPPGCMCPKGYTGDHCEYLSEDDHDDLEDVADGNSFAEDSHDGKDNTASAGSSSSSVSPTNNESSKPSLLVLAVSSAVIFIVLLFSILILRALFCGLSKEDVLQGALAEEETRSSAVTISKSSNNAINTSHGDDNDSLEEVEDYVNDHANVLTESEMENVQIV